VSQPKRNQIRASPSHSANCRGHNGGNGMVCMRKTGSFSRGAEYNLNVNNPTTSRQQNIER